MNGKNEKNWTIDVIVEFASRFFSFLVRKDRGVREVLLVRTNERNNDFRHTTYTMVAWKAKWPKTRWCKLTTHSNILYTVFTETHTHIDIHKKRDKNSCKNYERKNTIYTTSRKRDEQQKKNRLQENGSREEMNGHQRYLTQTNK